MTTLQNVLMSKHGFKTKLETAKSASPHDLANGQVLLEVDRFALTANVVSFYACMMPIHLIGLII